MRATFTKKVKEEIEHHVKKNYQVDLSKASFNKVEIKKDLRIKFLNYGMVYDPSTGHHLEFRFKNLKVANTTIQELSIYGISGKISINEEKKTVLVYIGDAKNVMEVLKVLGANESLKKYKKIYEYNEKAKTTNRQVNFETANIKRSAEAALEQVRIIEKLLKKRKIESIDNDLKVVIRARMKYKRVSMSELAEKIGNISKSALNHRFIRIKKMVGE